MQASIEFKIHTESTSQHNPMLLCAPGNLRTLFAVLDPQSSGKSSFAKATNGIHDGNTQTFNTLCDVHPTCPKKSDKWIFFLCNFHSMFLVHVSLQNEPNHYKIVLKPLKTLHKAIIEKSQNYLEKNKTAAKIGCLTRPKLFPSRSGNEFEVLRTVLLRAKTQAFEKTNDYRSSRLNHLQHLQPIMTTLRNHSRNHRTIMWNGGFQSGS